LSAVAPMRVPRIGARYWTAITLASIFGTNMGDLYAHESGLGIFQGLVVLAVLAAFAFSVERFDRISHESYYWLVIIIIRTGATNIADYIAFRLKIAPVILIVGLLSFACGAGVVFGPTSCAVAGIDFRRQASGHQRLVLESDADGGSFWHRLWSGEREERKCNKTVIFLARVLDARGQIRAKLIELVDYI
jgi:uncharacterized membrane-anchored protein